MNEAMRYFQSCLATAEHDARSEKALRDILRRVADGAPLSAVVELSHVLLDIRARDTRRAIERN